MAKTLAKAWRWREAAVNRRRDHFELRYGSADNGGWDEWLPVALVGLPEEGVFPVQFLIDENIRRREPNILSDLTKELDFYLVELGERDPWAYAQYHCGTASNAYSSIHWSFYAPKDKQTGYRESYRVNLFWNTRRLTQMREDHLTCFLAAALEVDADFRSAYEHRVFSSLATGDEIPRIVRVEIQPEFREPNCRPDMLLGLSDGRVIVCEHKLDAPETEHVEDDGEVKMQIERYLSLKVQGVAYFRTFLADSAVQFMSHDHYLHPKSAPHFLWQDLYEPLSRGRHDITRWLHEGFGRLGFTPPVPHVGPLWPDDSPEVQDKQLNFGKLWKRTRLEAGPRWRVSTGRRCELALRPLSPSLVTRVYISPIAQRGTLLRFRAETETKEVRQVVFDRLQAIAQDLPVEPELVVGELHNGRQFIDLLTSLHTLLGQAVTPLIQEDRLFKQVVPVLDALLKEN